MARHKRVLGKRRVYARLSEIQYRALVRLGIMTDSCVGELLAHLVDLEISRKCKVDLEFGLWHDRELHAIASELVRS